MPIKHTPSSTVSDKYKHIEKGKNERELNDVCIFTNKIMHLCTDYPRLLRPALGPRRYSFSWNERKIFNNDLRYMKDLHIRCYRYYAFWEIYNSVFGWLFGHQHSRPARHVLTKIADHEARVLSSLPFALPPSPLLSSVASFSFFALVPFLFLAATTTHCFTPPAPPSAPPPAPAGSGGPESEGAAILSSCRRSHQPEVALESPRL